MSQYAIRAAGLGKQYHIGGRQESYRTLRDSLTNMVSSPFRRVGHLLKGQSASDLTETMWAIKDVSFDIKAGEVVGIIGRNGAGKSTLLKILSRITEPTSGYVDVYGRIGALLEVGTGFHPELTGRENIYLNSAILGMKRAEINRKFDEIVAFADIAQFIDTPVKHFSSGMALRLGFAVAAHMEPEILIVDEVLAVGDAEFQKKCLGKMEDVANSGRTVLFVSHNMAAVSNLCQTGYLLSKGELVMCGSTSDVIAHYMQSVESLTQQSLAERKDRQGSGTVQFTNIRFRDSYGNPTDILTSGGDITIELDYISSYKSDISSIAASLIVNNHVGTHLFCCYTHTVNARIKSLKNSGKFICHIPKLPLSPGNYFIDLAMVVSGQTVDKISEAAQFTVTEGDFFGTG